MLGAKIRLRWYKVPLAWMWPLARMAAVAGLIGVLILGGREFLLPGFFVEALEFTPRTVATGALGVHDMAVSDLNSDGNQDIITAGSDGVNVYMNDGKEKFSRTLVQAVKARRLQIIDLDRDGDKDLLVTLKDTNPSVRWYRNDGAPEFNSGVNIGTGTDGVAGAGDIDGDGAVDIVTALIESGSQVTLRRWMNDGAGVFTSTSLSADSGVTAIAVGDVDGNGYQDIVTGGSQGLQRWNSGDGTTWSRSDIDGSNGNRSSLVIADVTGDGKNDVVTGDQSVDLVAVYRNQDNSTWQRIALTGDADAITVRAGDLDADGDQDILAAGQDDNNIFWYEQTSASEWKSRVLASGLKSVFSLAVADIDGDTDLDFVTGSIVDGEVFWYERVAAKPDAEAPNNMQQATDGSGRVTFDTTITDEDSDPTRIRVQYSTDGKSWHKPWITKVVPAEGKVDLKNSNPYQIGTHNAIDTDKNDSVKLTLHWDTKSVENTGGPIVGDVGTVQLRIIPRDAKSVGDASISNEFRVDNQAPKGLSQLRLASISETEAQLSWDKAADSSAFTFKVYYGTDATKVLEQRSAVWDETDDGSLADIESTGTTITGLTPNAAYSFKLVAVDKFGNIVATPSVKGRTVVSAPVTSGPIALPTVTPPIATSPTPAAETSAAPSPVVSATPTPPPVLQDNRQPVADAGLDQVVNPAALVILDGTASSDPDRDSLVYIWRQLAGPSVGLLSDRTATPSFSAGDENETYVFGLTVRDARGASATDIVTVATRRLPEPTTIPVEVTQSQAPPPVTVSEREEAALWLRLLDWSLLAIAVLSTILSLVERVLNSWRNNRWFLAGSSGQQSTKGKVVHYKTGEGIAGARVLVYGADGKLRESSRTNTKGEFSTLFPKGEYTLSIRAEGFAFAPAAQAVRPAEGILYTGGVLKVQDDSEPLALVVPMKPIGREIGSLQTSTLRSWQALQRAGRSLSWPLFLVGALLNTWLVFRFPSVTFLSIELTYVVLVIVKVLLEVRVRPAYGLVRDAITHVPLDLAVVRLYESKTNRLVMTRVTNSQGKFFALPPADRYTVTVSKPSYGVFTKQNVEIASERDSALQITVDLMPLTPSGGLARAQAAVI